MLSSWRLRLIVLFAACALVGAVIGQALAYWTGTGEPVDGTGAAVAASVNQGDTPTVSAEGASSVLVEWSATTMSDGDPVDGYLVTRYDAGTGVAQTTLAGCAETITATSCTESGIPVGDWKYAVTPVVGSNWRGAESAKSASIATTTIDFLQPITSPETVRAGPAGADTGDIDNDGDTDVVMANLFEATSSVLINNGVGDFRENLVISNGATIDAGLGKFDNDSNPDLVLLYPGTPPATGLLIIFKGGGDGSFTYVFGTNEIVNTGVRPTKLAVGTFNGDAIDDVAVVNSQNDPNTQAGTVMTFLGNPAGTDTFASATPAQTLTAQLGATDIAFADFNGGGGAGDLVVTNSASNSITFFAGNGTGFNAPANVAAGAPVLYMDTANLDAGANRDIVASVLNSNPSTVRTLFGDGAGGFPTQATTTAATAATGALPQAVVASDLDNDGDQDLAVANGDPKSVSVLDNHGNGAFSPVPTSPETDNMGAAGTVPFEIVSADFDGSGYNDLAVNNILTAPGQTRSLLNQSGNKADLSITQTDSPDPVDAGASLTYTLTVANAGPSTPTSVKASDTLPAGVTFNAAASSPSCSAGGTTTVTVTCDYGSVAPGTPESQQVVVTVGWTTPATIANTATVAGNLADPTPANNTSSATTTVNRDSTPPTHAFSLNSAAGAFLNGGGTTLYYKGNAAGSFKLVDALSDTFSGPASVTYPAIATTGWTHAAETVTTPAGGPYTSTTFSWTPSPANPSGYSVSGADNANNTSNAGLTFVNDTTAPAGGSVSYTSGYYTSPSVSVSFTKGTDGGSGVNATSGLLQRADATLAGGTCGGYGAFATVTGGTNPTSPFTDTTVASGNCYQYRYLISDNVGNQATYTSASVAKVDSTPPTVSRAVAAKTDGSTPGTIRQGGDYYVYAQVTDAGSGVSTVTGNTSSFDTGVTATSLSATGGPWTVGGQSYNYRSAVLTANTPLNTGSSYSYSITATDGAAHTTGPTSFSVAIQTYANVISTTPEGSPVSYWRMDDSGTGGNTTVVNDTFTGTAGTLLQSHIGQTGATWTRHTSSNSDAVITNENRVRRNGTGASLYYASGVPATADYSVQADINVKSTAFDGAAVIGRASTSANTYYRAGFFSPSPGPRWELYKVVNGTSTLLGSDPETLSVGSTHTVKLEMLGSRIRLLVNGSERVAVTDSSITAAGRAGLRLGYAGASGIPTDTTGLHLDNLTATVPSWLVDSAGTNTGNYLNGVTLGVAGALVGDANTAAQFDGVNDYALAPDSASLDLGDGPFTLEAWVKRNDTASGFHQILDKGSDVPWWLAGDGAFQWNFNGSDHRLNSSDHATIANFAGGGSDITTYHHWVATKNGAAVKLYRDGVDVTPAITNRTLQNTASGLYFACKYGGAFEFLNAQLDEIAIYNQVLPLATVQDHYNAGKGTG